MPQFGKTNTAPIFNRKALTWQFFTTTILVVYFYVFMEWLFFVTKPSFFDSISMGGKLSVLFKTSLVMAAFFCLMLFVMMVLSQMLSRILHGDSIHYLPVLIPTAILSVLACLLIDNFTYTIFKVGVVTTTGIWRGAYAVFFTLIFLFISRWLLKNIFREATGTKARQKQLAKNKLFQRLTLLLLAISVIFVLTDRSVIGNVGDIQPMSQLKDRPNILLLGGDGINAANMSAYGYGRETTPNISELAKKSLFFENAFANAGNSAGSVTTILTGKNATETRVLYPPDILRGTAAFQHLPGILHQLGYYTAELGYLHYIDASELNFQAGFDEVNTLRTQKSIVLRLLERFDYEVAYFASSLFDRASDRLLHVFYIKKMENAYKAILEPSAETNYDDKKVQYLLSLISETKGPLFVHIHMMVTHGDLFFPSRHVFSEGLSQDQPWMTDFYDDAILDYDHYVGEVIKQLARTGKLDNTIIVIYTDHNQQWHTNQRIPLIIYFPKGEHAGHVQQNVQNIDIAPTLLDYLGLPIPSWMEGVSLLQPESVDERLIFSAGAAYVKESAGLYSVDLEEIKPPFYQFGYLGIVNCQNWYRYNLVDNVWESGLVDKHTSKCSAEKLLSPEQIRDALLTHLASKGFDIASLQSKIGTPAPVLLP
jgi:arylsulfatase A-like enzyme